MVLEPAWNDSSSSRLAQLVNVAYPVTDVVLATVAILVVRWGAARRPNSIRMLAIAFVLMAAADSGFTYLTNHGIYTSANAIGVLWVGSYLALMLAARAPDVGSHLRSPSGRVEPVTNALLPYVPLAIALAVAIGRLVSGDELDGVLATLAAVQVGVILVRQAIALVEIRRLACDLDATLRVVNEQRSELAHLAWHDGLTGLANRAKLTSRLEAGLRSNLTLPAVVYIDLDGFKQVNDRMGHATGDQVLIQAAQRLQSCVDDEMLLARFGGDEFVILAPGGLDTGRRVARRILDSFGRTFELEGEHVDIGVSIGIAVAPREHSPEEVLRRADAAMYTAKRSGRSRVVLFPDETVAVQPPAAGAPIVPGRRLAAELTRLGLPREHIHASVDRLLGLTEGIGRSDSSSGADAPKRAT
jgi:diguanylate cyclase